jgi:hypothetical protein
MSQNDKVGTAAKRRFWGQKSDHRVWQRRAGQIYSIDQNPQVLDPFGAAAVSSLPEESLGLTQSAVGVE